MSSLDLPSNSLSSSRNLMHLEIRYTFFVNNEKYRTAMVKYSDIVNKDYAQKRTLSSRKQTDINQEKIQSIYDEAKKAVEHNPTYDNYVDYIIVCLTLTTQQVGVLRFLVGKLAKNFFSLTIINYITISTAFCLSIYA